MSEGNGKVGLRYRALGQDEWKRLEPLFVERGWHLPYKELAECIVAETEDGELAGGLVLQMVMHAEPGFVMPGFEGHVNFLHLHSILEQMVMRQGIFPGYITTITDAKQEGLAKHAGFEHIPGEVWRKQIDYPRRKTEEAKHARFIQ